MRGENFWLFWASDQSVLTALGETGSVAILSADRTSGPLSSRLSSRQSAPHQSAVHERRTELSRVPSFRAQLSQFSARMQLRISHDPNAETGTLSRPPHTSRTPQPRREAPHARRPVGRRRHRLPGGGWRQASLQALSAVRPACAERVPQGMYMLHVVHVHACTRVGDECCHHLRVFPSCAGCLRRFPDFCAD